MKNADFGHTKGLYRIRLTDEQRRDRQRRPDASGLAAATRDRLDIRRFARVWAAGRRLPLGQAMARARRATPA